MSAPSNVKSVIARAVARQKELDGIVDESPVELVVDNSAIIIAELEAELVAVAHNLATTRGRLKDWSKDVGEALTLMDKTLEENERLKSMLGISKAHLEVGQNAERNEGYIAAALEILQSALR